MLNRRGALILIFLAAIIPASAAQAHQVFTMDATIFKNDTVTVHELGTANGTVKTLAPDGSYNISLFDDGDRIYSDSFALTFTTIYFERGDGTTGSSHVPTDSERKLFRLPYDPGATEIRITRSGETIFNVSLEEELCGPDDVCSPYCQEEKRWQDDPDCERPDGSGEDGGVSYVSLLIGILLLVAAIGVYFFGIYRHGEEEQERPSSLR